MIRSYVTHIKGALEGIVLNKTDTNAYYNKALVLQTWGNYSGAIDNYNKELAVDKQLGLKPAFAALECQFR